jgi:hypothetical protein
MLFIEVDRIAVKTGTPLRESFLQSRQPQAYPSA